MYHLICSDEKMKKLDEKLIECEKCPAKSKACCYRGNIIRVICPSCNQDYKPKKKELIDYFRLRIIGEGNYNNSTYNQNILDNVMKEMRAYRIIEKEKETNKEISELECTAFNASVNCIKMLSNNRLCACSSDQSIKIFDIINGNNFVLKADKQLAHTDEIRCIEEIETNILASGGKGDIKIWRITNNLIANNE